MKEPRLHRCICGFEAEVWRLPLTGTYMVRCKDVDLCRNKTRPHLTEQYAVQAWNDGAWKEGED